MAQQYDGDDNDDDDEHDDCLKLLLFFHELCDCNGNAGDICGAVKLIDLPCISSLCFDELFAMSSRFTFLVL